MAAGLGQRYGGLKQFDPIHGHILLEYALFDALKAGFGKVVLLIRKNFENEFMEKFGKRIIKGVHNFNARIDFAYQESVLDVQKTLPFRKKMWGTGHAALCFKDTIKEPFALINADDFYGRESFEILHKFFTDEAYQHHGNVHSMIGFYLKNVVSPHGHVARGICEVTSSGYLKSIVEKEKVVIEDSGIYSIENSRRILFDGNAVTSMNFWGFNPEIFRELEAGFSEFYDNVVERKEPKKEFYVSDFIGKLINSGRVKIKVLETTGKWFGMTYKKDYSVAEKAVKKLIDRGAYQEKLW